VVGARPPAEARSRSGRANRGEAGAEREDWGVPLELKSNG
jgi:hypothetical protein